MCNDGDDIHKVENCNNNQQSLYQKINSLQTTISEHQIKEQHLKDQHSETAKREAYLLTKLAYKDHTINELKKTINNLKAKCCGPIVTNIYKTNQQILENVGKNISPESTTLINDNFNKWNSNDNIYLTDPAINILFDDLKNELKSTKEKLDDIQLAYQICSSNQPSDQSLMIRQLLTKCRMLRNENKYLTKELTLGKNIKIEHELILTKKLNDNLLAKLSETEQIIHIQDEQMKKFQGAVIKQQCLLTNSTTSSTK